MKLLSNITTEAEKLTDSPQMQKILIEFAEKQLLTYQSQILKNMKQFIPIEYQVMLILEQLIQTELGVDDFRKAKRNDEDIIVKHIFIWTANYFLNIKESRSEFGKRLYNNDITSKTNSRNIAKFIGLKQHGSVINAISQIDAILTYHKYYKTLILELTSKAEIILTCCYS
jgi:hypothetical protein